MDSISVGGHGQTTYIHACVQLKLMPCSCDEDGGILRNVYLHEVGSMSIANVDGELLYISINYRSITQKLHSGMDVAIMNSVQNGIVDLRVRLHNTQTSVFTMETKLEVRKALMK